jgi:hypothetical protein
MNDAFPRPVQSVREAGPDPFAEAQLPPWSQAPVGLLKLEFMVGDRLYGAGNKLAGNKNASS